MTDKYDDMARKAVSACHHSPYVIEHHIAIALRQAVAEERMACAEVARSRSIQERAGRLVAQRDNRETVMDYRSGGVIAAEYIAKAIEARSADHE